MGIWTPPRTRQPDMKSPFDFAYATQLEIAQTEALEHKRELAAEALSHLATAKHAFEGMDMTVTTKSALLPDPTKSGGYIVPTKTVSIIGKCEGFHSLDMSQYGGDINQALTLQTTAMWPVDKPNCMDFPGQTSYTMFAGALRVRY